MSRGLGATQERLLAVLARKIGGEFVALETSYLKELAGCGDRSNLRRAIRNLVRRGLVREREHDGRRYHALTFTGFVAAVRLYPATPADLLHDVLEELFGSTGLSLNTHDPMDADDLPEGDA